MELFLSTLLGFVSSFVSWWILFHTLSPRVRFSKEISRLKQEKNLIDKAEFVYHYKLINSGIRDIVDIEIIETLAIKIESPDFPNTWDVISLRKFGHDSLRIPVLRPNKPYNLQGQSISLRLINCPELLRLEPMQQLKGKIDDLTLEIKDVFSLFPNSEIRVNIMGSDSLSGARKVFSHHYNPSAIKNGRFGKALEFIAY